MGVVENAVAQRSWRFSELNNQGSGENGTLRVYTASDAMLSRLPKPLLRPLLPLAPSPPMPLPLAAPCGCCRPCACVLAPGPCCSADRKLSATGSRGKRLGGASRGWCAAACSSSGLGCWSCARSAASGGLMRSCPGPMGLVGVAGALEPEATACCRSMLQVVAAAVGVMSARTAAQQRVV